MPWYEMNLLPIVERELRSASMESGTYWWRVCVGFFGVVLLGSVIALMQFVPVVRFGMPAVFKTFRFFAVVYCLVSGLRLTSDCISREKRDGTLGFLFLTPLRGYDVILGKLVSKGVPPLYTLMVIVPLVWLVSLMGGVGGGELLFTVIAIGNALFFSLAVGVTVSTFFRDRRTCEFMASISVFVLFFGVFPLADLFVHPLVTGIPGTWALGTSPIEFLVNRVNAVADPSFAGMTGVGSALVSNAVVHIASWGLIAVSSLWIPYCWRERPPSGARLSLKQRWMQWCYGAAQTRTLRRKIALDVNPFFWRATRNRLRPLIPWVCIIFTLGIYILIESTIGFSPAGFYFFAMFMIVFWNLAPKIWLAREASRTFSDERSDGTLEMILSTPLSVHEIIRGQWMGLRKCYLPAFVFPVVASGILIVLINFVPSMSLLTDLPYATPLLAVGTILFIADCITVSWVGMWCGLKTGNAKAAARASTFRVITLPVLFFALCFFTLAMLNPLQRFPGVSVVVLIGLWFAIGLTFDIILIKSSRALLYREIRNIVQEPAHARDAWARALGRWLGRKVRQKTRE